MLSSNLILALIRVVLQVADIGNIAHIANLVTKVLEVAIEKVERDSRARMSQVCIAIHGRTADIHAYVSFVQWAEDLFLSR